jgi:CRISPR-associated protein Csd1
MSWTQKLYKTYENSQHHIGLIEDENKIPLLPICHTTNMAHVEITIDEFGNFLKGSVIPKRLARTIIPCTEESGGRTRGEAPHPLCDKLQYIAADFKFFGGGKKSYFNSFVSQLEKWSSSEYSDQKLTAILNYVKKGKVIHDLIEAKVLFVDNNQKLLKKVDKKNLKPNLRLFRSQRIKPIHLLDGL